MRAVTIGLVVGGVLLVASGAMAQTNQIKPRVMVMLDTSGSMTEYMVRANNVACGNSGNCANQGACTGTAQCVCDTGVCYIDTRADGSTSYTDGVMTRSIAANTNNGMYPGAEIGALVCPAAAAQTYHGPQSRMYNGKAALTNVIYGAGDIDWGLERYVGFDCPLVNTFTATATACTSDDNCGTDQFCVGGFCGSVNNLCDGSQYGGTNQRGGTCSNKYNLPVTYGGDTLQNINTTACGTPNAGGAASPCFTPQTCFADKDCNAMAATSCAALTGSGAKACKCGGGLNCPANYTCGAGGFCMYNLGCQTPGGQIMVDPAAPGFASTQVLPYVDNIEDYTVGATKSGTTAGFLAGAPANQVRVIGLVGMRLTDVGKAMQLSGANTAANNGTFTITTFINATTVDIRNSGAVVADTKSGTIAWNVKYPANPELRAITATPLAGSARTATSWYKSVSATDTQATCRPYVLVQITDGLDTCETSGGSGGSAAAGPVAAAQSFVAATVAGAKNVNKVYVIGLSLSSPTLDNIAAAGGTFQARLATSQQDIEAALADIVSSSVLKEICNGSDDNCDGQCDENFPGVAVNNPGKDGKPCSNAHSAAACNNGYPSTTSCYDTGVFICSSDTLSQVCSAQICIGAAGGTLTSPAAGVMRISNALNIPSSAVGQLFRVSGASKAANNGLFVVTALGVNTVDVANAAVNMPDAALVVYGYPSMQGAGTITVPVANTERITLTSGATGGVLVGDQITILNAAPAADNGTFTVTAVTATTIDVTNNAAVAGTMPGRWVDLRICPGVEICNGKDDDCNGVIDDCTAGVANSCCTSSCPACAKSPFLEVCNNCDDDCDGIIDNNLTDVGATCDPNNTGDCAPSKWKCCSNDPNNPAGGSCAAINGSSDALYCVGGNPGYPKLTDQCDGTDDNCNGVANDGPSPICFDDGTPGGPLPMGKDGVGICHHGVQQCLTTPLPAGDPGCPATWPPGKVCPRTPPAVGPCTGLQKPLAEMCNGRDDDCDGVVDNGGATSEDWSNPADPNYANAHPCCITGNKADCMNTGTGVRCKLGGFACVNGMKTCVGSVAKSLEVCDTVDNDCNGPVDDVPGLNTPCTGNGVETRGTCTARLECVLPNPVPQCVQKTGPVAETCNGKDDNCNGKIDDTDPPLAPPGGKLPEEGMVCMAPVPPADKLPCKAGMTVCVAGMVECQGAVGPMPNQCNGISTDCTGMPNTNGNCPTGFQCYQGNCAAPCMGGEFPCPGGYKCQQSTMLCIPDECAKITCPAGFNCNLDSSGMATCIDPCVNVSCPPTYICKLGVCVDASCRTQGCPSGEICVATGSNMFGCQPDPCADVICPDGQFCSAGSCVGACIGPCPSGQFCDRGQCSPDPCGKLPCIAGQVCSVQNGVGVCVENQCQFGCGFGQACCGGSCVADQCEHLHCPEDTHCALTSSCNATCETNPQSPKDQIVGAGGGGFGCAVGGGHERTPSLAWLLVVAGALLFRRRRTGEVRR